MSDLSKCKAGDLVATVQRGWVKVTNNRNSIDDLDYPVKLSNGKVYSRNGRYNKKDKYPTAFTEEDCPYWLYKIIGPPPCEFKKGDRVICSGHRRYFSHEEGNQYCCFVDGKDEWSSDGVTMGWPQRAVKKWEGENYPIKVKKRRR